MNHPRPSPLLFERKKNHPWIRPTPTGHPNGVPKSISRSTTGTSSTRLLTESYQRHKRSIQRSRVTTGLTPLDTAQDPQSQQSSLMPSGGGTSVSSRSSHTSDGGLRISPRGASPGQTFQTHNNYRSSQPPRSAVRKHPWRTDVRGRGGLRASNKRNFYRTLVKSTSTAPWDEMHSILEEEPGNEYDDVSCEPSVAQENKEMSGCLPEEENEQEEKKVESSPHPPPFVALATGGAGTPGTTPAQDTLLDALRVRVQQVYQGDHYIVEGTGQGLGKPQRKPSQYDEEQHIVRQQLVQALRERLQHVYTGHLQSLEARGRQDMEEKINEEEDEEDDYDGDQHHWDEMSAVSMDESVVSVQSMIVAATLLRTGNPSTTANQLPAKETRNFPVSAADQPSSAAETEWEEYTVYSDKPEDDEQWEEVTVASEALSRHDQLSLLAELSFDPKTPLPVQMQGRPRHMFLGELHHPKGRDELSVNSPSPQVEEEEQWDEETVATEALPRSQQIELLKASLPEFPYTKPKKETDNTEELSRSQQIEMLKASVPEIPPLQPKEEDANEWDEYTVEFDEYTVQTIADALMSLPNALQGLQGAVAPPPAVTTESTSKKTSKVSSTSIAETVKSIVEDSRNRLAELDVEEESYVDEIIDEFIEEDYDDDHWDDYTVETVADAFASLPRTLQLEFLRSSTRTATNAAAVPETTPGEEENDVTESSSMPPPEGAYAPEQEAEVEVKKAVLLDPNGTDPTMSSTDSSGSEKWHDARSMESGDADTAAHEVRSGASTDDGSRESRSRKRRSRCPPTNLNQILKNEMFSKDLSVVEGALRTLTEKADADLEYRAHIVRSGGILAIVRAMQQNVYNAGVQLLACRTLAKIATDPENRMSIGEVGGVEAVVGAMSEHAGEEAVAEATCLTLWILTSDCAPNQRSIETAALDIIVSCMRRYAKNPIVQEKAFQTLANLCLHDAEKLVALSQMGGFVVMSTALVLHWENPTVKNEAISTLAQLFGRLAVTQHAE